MILDEAGMVDHKRMDALTELIDRSGAKLIAVGDGKQLPSIGPGGMFDRIAGRAPTAELADVRRTSDPEERKAWAALRAGEPEQAMAHYQARGQLFFNDTRDQAGEAAVQRWAELTKTRDIREVALIADASNIEIDRLNARAQHLRAERGELGSAEVPLPTPALRAPRGRPDHLHRAAPHHQASRGSRTAPAARSHESTTQRPDRSRSTAPSARSRSLAKTLRGCGSPMPSTSTASRARPSSAPSS